MSYASGQLIEVDHFNEFVSGSPIFGVVNHGVTNVNTNWGVGLGDYGYGQTPELSELAVGTTVSAAQWMGILTNMDIMAAHNGSSLGAMTDPMIGDDIDAIPLVKSNLDTLYLNRLNGLGFSASDQDSASAAGSWTISSVHQIQAQWDNADKARYFFNGAGRLELSYSRTGGTANSKNTEWTDLLNDSGTYHMTAQTGTKIGGAAPSAGEITNNFGYYDMTDSYQLLHRQFAGGVYSSNSIELECKREQVDGTNGDNGRRLNFRITLTDAAGDPPGVNGTTQCTCVERPPSTSALSDSWGSVNWTVSVVQT